MCDSPIRLGVGERLQHAGYRIYEEKTKHAGREVSGGGQGWSAVSVQSLSSGPDRDREHIFSAGWLETLATTLTLSPSSVVSSAESTKSYGLDSAMSSYQGVGSTVEALLADEGHSFNDLHSLAQKHLKIFDDPAYSRLDEPDWLKRATSHTSAQPKLRFFTVRNLVNTMFHVAKDLELEKGQRYVAAAICACAVEANAAGSSPEEKQKRLARNLQRLASTWAGFLLWPCKSSLALSLRRDPQLTLVSATPVYAAAPNKRKRVVVSDNEVSESATPTISETVSFLDKGLAKTRSSELRNLVCA